MCIRDRGYDVVPSLANQGAGAATSRIEAVRRLFPSMWFNEPKTKGGLEAIGWYHEKKDEKRGIGLGPNHDWSSHAADALGLMAVYHSLYRGKRERLKAAGQVAPVAVQHHW